MLELKLPELGENIETVQVSNVLVAVGDAVRPDQPVLEVETEKASLEIPAPAAGVVRELRVKAGDKIRVDQVILVLDTAVSAAPPARPTAVPAPVPVPIPAPARPAAVEAPPAPEVIAFPQRTKARPVIAENVPAAPSVRALARQLGVEVAQVPGSGPGGRLSRDDVKAYAKRRIEAASAGAAAVTAPALPDFSAWGEIEREPLSNVRRATAQAMSVAWATVPHVTQFDRADVTELESLRRRFNARPGAEVKLTLTAIAVKMTAAALRQFPRFNSSLDLAGDAVIHKRYVHVGVAVETERGLLVPVLRDADRKGLLEIAAELAALAERARARRLGPDEMRGASFTISNLGGLGTTYFSPIVNWPEVAILGIGRADMQAVWQDEQFRPRLVLPLAISYDHRLIDGADAARFLRRIAESLEQPLLLLLEEPAR
ncbi:MAG TPA: 2-oxo acid dehydrogenase subunit E2 [Candidatus Polarisedimenticolaceae bacterium]|nr:2-oxo acid dehydrogenase subunit E2 [Candidatus Polarisedimenticolaceae bacterium]